MEECVSEVGLNWMYSPDEWSQSVEWTTEKVGMRISHHLVNRINTTIFSKTILWSNKIKVNAIRRSFVSVNHSCFLMARDWQREEAKRNYWKTREEEESIERAREEWNLPGASRRVWWEMRLMISFVFLLFRFWCWWSEVFLDRQTLYVTAGEFMRKRWTRGGFY